MQPFICEVCTYPAYRSSDCCDNPACEANPSISQDRKDSWRAERVKREAEEAERERIRRIRRQMLK